MSASVSTTRLINNWFRSRLYGEEKSFGVYTPPKNIRRPPDYVSPVASVESDESDYFGLRECPLLDSDGNQIYDEDGKPKMVMKEVKITKAEFLAEKEEKEAEAERLEREKQEEEQRKFHLLRSKHMAIFKKWTEGEEVCTISTSGQIMRALGYSPTMNEITLIHETLGDTLTLDQLYDGVEMIEKVTKSDELAEAFKVWDYRRISSGTLSRKQMINILSVYGEDPLTSDEACAVLEATGHIDDRVDYRIFVDDLFDISSETSSN